MKYGSERNSKSVCAEQNNPTARLDDIDIGVVHQNKSAQLYSTTSPDDSHTNPRIFLPPDLKGQYNI